MKLIPDSFFRKIKNFGIAVLLFWAFGTIVAWTISGPEFSTETEIMNFAFNLSFTGTLGFLLLLIGIGKGDLFATVKTWR